MIYWAAILALSRQGATFSVLVHEAAHGAHRTYFRHCDTTRAGSLLHGCLAHAALAKLGQHGWGIHAVRTGRAGGGSGAFGGPGLGEGELGGGVSLETLVGDGFAAADGPAVGAVV